MKAVGNNSTRTQKVFRKIQWKFTFIMIGIMAGLIATAFFAIYLFTTLSNQMAIDASLTASLDTLSAYLTQQDELEHNPDYEIDPDDVVTVADVADGCAMYVVEGEIDENDYSVSYDITASYNLSLLGNESQEFEQIETAIYETVEQNFSFMVEIDSVLERTYLTSVMSITKQEVFKVYSQARDEDESEDIEDGDVVGQLDDTESVSGAGEDGTDENTDENPGTDEEGELLPEEEYVEHTVTVNNKYFAIYDYSAEQYTLITLVIVLGIVFLIVIIIMSFFAYLLSGRLLKPARDADIRQKELIANASHELKTPITIINANLDVMTAKEQSTIAENKKWIENIQQQSLRMRDLVVDMLELFRYESEEYKANNKVLDVSSEVEGVALSFEASCYDRRVKLETDIKKGVVATMDANGFGRLMHIIMENATKYCDYGGRVRVKLDCTVKNVILRVSNTGKMIPKDEIARVFDRFHKVGDASRSYGLGLAMARSIVQKMNGEIGCTSIHSLTVFTVKLPLRYWRK